MNRAVLRSLQSSSTHLNHVLPSPTFNRTAPFARHIHGSRATWGVMDSLRSSYRAAFGGAEEKREQAVYDAQQEFLLDRNRKMNADGYLELLAIMKSASGMSGVKEHLPWVQNNPGLQDFKDREAVLCALTPAERRDLSLVRISAKKRVAASTGKDIEFVDSLLEQVDTMKMVRQWLIKREDEGLPLPKNSNEMRSMLSMPGAGLKRRRKGRGFPNPGLGQVAKRR